MPELPPSAPRFFARIKAAEVACPGCGEMQLLSHTTAPSVWNPRIGRFRCVGGCGRVWLLGVVAWAPAKYLKGTNWHPAEDATPTVEEALRLRNALSVAPGVKRATRMQKAAEGAKHPQEPRNVVAQQDPLDDDIPLGLDGPQRVRWER